MAEMQLDACPDQRNLSIYLWLQQARDMPAEHCLLPLVLQRFFLRYLGRIVIDPAQPGQSAGL